MTSSPAGRSAFARDTALACGFDAAGVAAAEPLDPRPLRGWLADGCAGGLRYMREGRADPRRVLPAARSILCVALAYPPADPSGPAVSGGAGAARGRIARYARFRDYHDVVRERLRDLAARLRARFPGARFRAAVDTAPLMEKPLAARAGLGWQGKHSLLVHPRLGSGVALGELLTDLEMEPGTPVSGRCGACARCVEACPTGALVAAGRVDARRCIAYLTLEHRGSIPPELRPRMEDRVFGCDACQEACPWNREEVPGPRTRVPDPVWRPGPWGGRAPGAGPGMPAPVLADLLALDEAGFEARFGGTPVARAGRAGMARNACIALGNRGGRGAAGALRRALRDPDPVVREHAAWALGRPGA
jgi:epoxyqueuosine reductase